MLFAIIWAVFAGTAFLVAIIRDEAYKKKRERELQIFRNNTVTMPKHPEIEIIGGEDCYPIIWQETAEEYQLILWLRYDIEGLRLNDDGSFEWIRKSKEEVQYEYYTDYVQDILGNSHPIQRRRPVSVSYQPQQTINKEIYELEEKIRNYPKESSTYPDEYWIMIHTLSELYKCQHIQESLTKCCCEEYGLPKV